MTEKEFFDWLRAMQNDKKLSQNEVDSRIQQMLSLNRIAEDYFLLPIL